MVFKNFLSGKNKASIYLGAPEAEAESSSHSRVQLIDVYEDYHNLLEQLSYEKFIVIGRKGSGKSAFAEYVSLLAKGNPNLFSDFIRKDKVDLEQLVQLGVNHGYEINKEHIFRWLIYTNILKLFSENEIISSDKNYDQLRQFLKKNSGFIAIDKNQIDEIVRKHGFEVNIDPLKRFIKSKLNLDFEFKESRAPFYKMIPHLEEVILKVMTSREERKNENSYAIFFDDLDIGFNANDQNSVSTIVDLLRTCKSINNDVFGKNDIHAKAYVLMRDDFEKFISSIYADTAKLFSSYSANIRWYQDEIYRNSDETQLNIRKFINKRIAYAFKNEGLSCNSTDPWSTLIDRSNNSEAKTCFKHLIDHTLFRPRDLLLLFQPLENGNYSIPLKRDDIKLLLDQYSEKLVKELKNELSSFYTKDQVEHIFVALGHISKMSGYGGDAGISYQQATKCIESCIDGVNSHEVLEDLFNRSMIGAKELSGLYKYKCREPIGSAMQYKLGTTDKIVVQYSIRSYVADKYA